MTITQIEIERIERALRKAWSAETSSKWTASNPALGQCSVTALVVQDLLGGDICKTLIGGAWHFYNRVEDRRFDFTADQFALAPEYLDLPSTRDEASLDTTETQYRALVQRMALDPGLKHDLRGMGGISGNKAHRVAGVDLA